MLQLPRLSGKEYLIMELLIDAGEMYGLELVKESEGRLKRGTVYVTLMRMESKGYISSSVEQTGGPPRRRFRVTGHGRRIFEAWQLAGNRLAQL